MLNLPIDPDSAFSDDVDELCDMVLPLLNVLAPAIPPAAAVVVAVVVALKGYPGVVPLRGVTFVLTALVGLTSSVGTTLD